MKKIILITSILISLFIKPSTAQEDTTKLKGIVYSFVPQYLINSGIRIDIEKQITPRSFIQICPQFYLGEKNNNNSSEFYYDDTYYYDYYYDNDDYNKLVGGGLNIYHKVFANSNFLKKGIYFSYGLSYSYFEIDYYEKYLNSTINANAKIQKYGGDLLIGYQLFLKNKLSIDVYTGLGVRNSNMETDSGNRDRFNSSYFGYNYTGNLMHLGFRIGLIL